MGVKDNYPVENLIWNQQITMIIDRLLVAVMLACFCVPMIMVVNHIVTGWLGWYVIPVVFIVAIESMYSHYRMRGISIDNQEWWLYRIAELVVIVILLKLTLYGIRGFNQILTDFSLWRGNLITFFNDPEYFLLVLFIAAIWLISGELDHEFYQIEGDEKLLRVELDTGFSEQRFEVRQRLANAIIVGGGIMIVLVAIINLGNGSIGMVSDQTRLGVIAILLYFVSGLILLSLTQFSILRVRWIINHVQVSRKVTIRWIAYSLLLVFGLTGIAFLLPTGYSSQFLKLLQYGIGIIIVIIQFIIYFITLPFILLFSWIMGLFKSPVSQPSLRPMPLQPLNQMAASEPLPWLEVLKTVLLFGGLIGLVGYAFYYYFKEHPEYFNWTHRSHFFIGLAHFWSMLIAWVKGVNTKIVGTIQNSVQSIRLRNTRRISAVTQRFFNPGRMEPRQQVIFYYLALIKRGTQAGLPRAVSQTPQEYSEQLKNSLEHNEVIASNYPADIPEDIAVLTQGFIEARYSRHTISTNQAGLVRRTWERISKMIRSLKK